MVRLVACSVLLIGAGASATPGWLDEVQTYTMLPLLPEDAKSFNVSVNGVWAGFGGDDPILPRRDFVLSVREKYGDDAKAFAEDCHKAGLIVCSGIMGTEGFEALLEDTPNLHEMACWNAKGEPITGSQALMCANNPHWLRWEIDYGKRGIDAGADWILVDTPMTSAIATGALGAGMCPYCLDILRGYLENNYSKEEQQAKFDLTSLEDAALRKRLARSEGKPQAERLRDPLYHEFLVLQEKASVETRKKLVDALREYCREQSREVAFATNGFSLSTMKINDYWVRALIFTDVFDIFAYELTYAPDGKHGGPLAKLPRAKWAAYHKLGHELRGRRAPAVVPADSLNGVYGDIEKYGRSVNAWMGAWAAEAYAANGAFINYYGESETGSKEAKNILWSQAFDVNGFVQEHKDLYDGALRSGSPLAIVFLQNDRGRLIPGVYPSYLGFAQGLVEGGYPFDVVFGGDGDYVKDRLTAEDLAGYSALLVPSPIAPTESQREIVADFVRNGGTLVCQEPDRLGIEGTREAADADFLQAQIAFGKGSVLVLTGEVTDTWTGDIGAEYFRDYTAAGRSAIGALAQKLGVASMLTDTADGLIGAFPIVQQDRSRMVVHLVNYDIDFEKDTYQPRADVPLTLAIPSWMEGQPRVEVVAPGASERLELQPEVDGDVLKCTVPRLERNVVIVVTAAS